MRSGRLVPFALLGCAGLAALAYGCLSAPAASEAEKTVPPRGCTPPGAAAPRVAPMGYYTVGGTVCAADGTPHLFHGVDRPSLEWASTSVIPASDFQLMAGWGANVVRIALNQDFWLSGAALYDSSYASTVRTAVANAEAAGLDVILDLHWSDCGDLTVNSTSSQGCGNSNQQQMADPNSIEFWSEVAAAFKGDGRVLFELYNEPHGVSWDVWLHGGRTGAATWAGMQQLYDAVRAAGADNVVVAGGLDWAFDLSDVGPDGHFVEGYNVMYATHPYLTSNDLPTSWESSFGHLETTDFAPVIATEFGDGRTNCDGSWDQQVIDFVDAHHGSWTAWAWFVADCHFPALLDDWDGTPSVQGEIVRRALQTYPASERSAADGGAEAGAPGEAAASDAGVDGGVDEGAADAVPIDEGEADGSPDGPSE